jgi:acyl-CoA thioester hydrolase
METNVVGNFQIRHYECDVQGHMYAPNYIALVEESAYEALSDMVSTDGNTRWLPRALYARHKGSLTDEDTAKVMSEILHETDRQLICRCNIANARTGDDAAYIEAQWVMSSRGAIEGLPVDAAPSKSAESAGSSDRQLSKAERLSLPERPERPVVFTRKVEVRDVDRSTTTTFKALADYMVEAGVRGAEEFGWPFDRVREAGIGFFVREQWIKCLKGISLRDELEISTWVSDFKRISGIRNYELRDVIDPGPVVKAQTVWACVDISTGAPTRLPNEFVADIQPHMSK